MRISDWSSDVCSSDLPARAERPERQCVELLAQRLRAAERLVDRLGQRPGRLAATTAGRRPQALPVEGVVPGLEPRLLLAVRSEEHTSELQSLMRISYAVFCLKKKTYNQLVAAGLTRST